MLSHTKDGQHFFVSMYIKKIDIAHSPFLRLKQPNIDIKLTNKIKKKKM